jgi:hypothetical protein
MLKEGDMVVIEWPGSEFDGRLAIVDGIHLKDVSINFIEHDQKYPKGISLRYRYVKKVRREK